MSPLRSTPCPLFAGALLAMALASSCGSKDDVPVPKPNVIVVVIDTLRADHLPFYGYGKDTAPFLNSLAQRGVVFDRAWAPSSWTAPSAASIFTGMYPLQHGVTQGLKLVKNIQQNVDPSLKINRIPSQIETLPEFMSSLGYRTYGIADNPNITDEEGFQSGFEFFHTFENDGGEKINGQLAQWAPQIKQDENWFVYLHYMDPHFPYEPRKPWFEAPDGLVVPGPQELKAMDPEVARPVVSAMYDSEIRAADEFIREAFEMIGADENTVVLFVADHGEGLYQRDGKLEHGFLLYSELLHVPFLIVHPGTKPARSRVQVNVSLVDLLPTLREILGTPQSPLENGESLVKHYMASEPPANDRTIFSMRSRLEVFGGQRKRAVIHGNDKFIVTYTKEGEEFELFDIGNDWGELEDRALNEGQRVAELHRLWKQYEEQALNFDGETSELNLSPEQIRALESLGYVESASEKDEE